MDARRIIRCARLLVTRARRRRRRELCACVTCVLLLLLILRSLLLRDDEPRGERDVRHQSFRTTTQTDDFSAEEMAQFRSGWGSEEHPRFLSYIRARWLVRRSRGPVSVSPRVRGNDYSEVGQSAFVDKLLAGRKNGFFVECGAADGRLHSNSLFFELERNWTGLLIEPNPELYQRLLRAQRNAFSINACLSTNSTTQRDVFKAMGTLGGIASSMDATHLNFIKRLPHFDTSSVIAQCFTLHSLLLALGRRHVHYLSLDVNGPEVEILRTIPFNKLWIDVVSVQYRVNDMIQIFESETLEKLKKIRDFFESLGNYLEVGILPWGTFGNKDRDEAKGLDVIFKRTGL